MEVGEVEEGVQVHLLLPWVEQGVEQEQQEQQVLGVPQVGWV
jgi:hypothetical protein